MHGKTQTLRGGEDCLSVKPLALVIKLCGVLMHHFKGRIQCYVNAKRSKPISVQLSNPCWASVNTKSIPCSANYCRGEMKPDKPLKHPEFKNCAVHPPLPCTHCACIQCCLQKVTVHMLFLRSQCFTEATGNEGKKKSAII